MDGKELSRQLVTDIAERLGIRIADGEVDAYVGLVETNRAALALIDMLPDEVPPLRYPRRGFSRPTPADNLLGAWSVRTEITGAPTGKLAGRRVAVKDNVLVAGVPLRNGTSILGGYVPSVDATIIERMLDAGATIVGKTV